jgi:phospholipid/cholesterol/gamma-HCH transport system substrate-binding protein
MIKLTREFKTGLVAIFAIAVLIWGFNFLKGQNIFDRASNSYFVMFDNVEGLSESSDVTINGLKVGSVLGISYDPETNKGLKVQFTITEDMNLFQGSEVLMYAPSLLGSKSLKIIPVFSGELAGQGYVFSGSEEKDLISSLSSQIGSIETNLNTTLKSVNTTFENINVILDDETQSNLKESIANLNKSMAQLNSITSENGQLQGVLSNAETMTAELSKFGENLNTLDLELISTKLNTSLDEVNNLLLQMESGEGTLGQLLYDDALYENLTAASEELEELLRNVKENPKRFVHFSLFGKKEKSYVENDTLD